MSDYGPIVDLLEPYLNKVKPSGQDNIMSLCPLPGHDEHKASFAINTANGLWMCHGCGRSGGLVTLLRALGVSPKNIDGMIEPIRQYLHKHQRKEKRRRENRLRSNPLEGERLLPEELLGIYNWKPLDLVEQGFEPKLLRELNIGYDRAKDRIIYPLRDTYGNLLGVAGRATIPGDQPRYKVYTGGKRGQDGEWVPGDFGPEFDEQFHNYSLDSHNHLWNGHRVYASSVLSGKPQPLFIVEGFKACIWLIQHGWPNTVALMGSYLTRAQYDLLCLMVNGPVILFLDNDEAGRKATRRIGKWLTRSMRVEVCSYYPRWAEEPDALNMAGLTETIEARERYASWEWHRRQEERLVSAVI